VNNVRLFSFTRRWIPEVRHSKQGLAPAIWSRTSTEKRSRGWTTHKCYSCCCRAATKPHCGRRRWSSRPSRRAAGVESRASANWRRTADTGVLGSGTTCITGTNGRSVRTSRPVKAGVGKSHRCSDASAPNARRTISKYVHGVLSIHLYRNAEG